MGSQVDDSGARDPAAVKLRLQELAQKFVTRTTQDLQRMRDGLARLDAGDRAGLDEIRQLAHRACGTGGTLGLFALSDAASDLERLIDALPLDVPPGAAECAQVAAGVDRFAAQLALL